MTVALKTDRDDEIYEVLASPLQTHNFLPYPPDWTRWRDVVRTTQCANFEVTVMSLEHIAWVASCYWLPRRRFWENRELFQTAECNGCTACVHWFVCYGSKLCGRMQNSLQRHLTGNPSCPHVGGAGDGWRSFISTWDSLLLVWGQLTDFEVTNIRCFIELF